jgi:hypothetical protein
MKNEKGIYHGWSEDGYLQGFGGKGEELEDPGVDGRIILRQIFEYSDGEDGLYLSVSRQRHVAGSCECGNELSGSIKCREFPN